MTPGIMSCGGHAHHGVLKMRQFPGLCATPQMAVLAAACHRPLWQPPVQLPVAVRVRPAAGGAWARELAGGFNFLTTARHSGAHSKLCCSQFAGAAISSSCNPAAHIPLSENVRLLQGAVIAKGAVDLFGDLAGRKRPSSEFASPEAAAQQQRPGETQGFFIQG